MEMLSKSMVDKVTGFMNIVSTIPPSRIDGFISGLNMLMGGKVACYQVILHAISLSNQRLHCFIFSTFNYRKFLCFSFWKEDWIMKLC